MWKIYTHAIPRSVTIVSENDTEQELYRAPDAPDAYYTIEDHDGVNLKLVSDAPESWIPKKYYVLEEAVEKCAQLNAY